MPPVFALGEQKDFVSRAESSNNGSVRTLRITLLASLAGWVVGVLAGTAGGIVLTWLEYGAVAAFRALASAMALLSVVRWAFMVAVAMVPYSLLAVAPLVFRALGRASFWGPLKAAGIGGAIGVAGLVPWWLVVSLFTTPINWSRPGEGAQALSLFGGTALLAGATVRWVAVLTARLYASQPPATPGSAPQDLPPAVPYEY